MPGRCCWCTGANRLSRTGKRTACGWRQHEPRSSGWPGRLRHFAVLVQKVDVGSAAACEPLVSIRPAPPVSSLPAAGGGAVSDPTQTGLAVALRRAREARRLSRRELAARLHVSEKTLGRWEHEGV